MAGLRVLGKRPYRHGDGAVIIGLGIYGEGDEGKESLLAQGSAYLPYDARGVNIFCQGVGTNHYISKHFLRKVSPRDVALAALTPTGHWPTGGEYDPRRNAEHINILVDEAPGMFLTDDIILSAHSAGCRDAFEVACGRDDIKGILAFSPARDLYDAFTRKWHNRYAAKIPWVTGPLVRHEVNCNGWQIPGTENTAKFRLESFPALVRNVKSAGLMDDYVREGFPPVLIFHGTHDQRVPYHHAEALKERLEENGVEHELVPVDSGHYPFLTVDELDVVRPGVREFFGRLIGQENPPEGVADRLRKDVEGWMTRRLRELYL